MTNINKMEGLENGGGNYLQFADVVFFPFIDDKCQVEMSEDFFELVIDVIGNNFSQAHDFLYEYGVRALAKNFFNNKEFLKAYVKVYNRVQGENETNHSIYKVIMPEIFTKE